MLLEVRQRLAYLAEVGARGRGLGDGRACFEAYPLDGSTSKGGMNGANSGEVRNEVRENFVNDLVVQPSWGKAAIPPRSCRPLPKGYTEG